jgi:thymidylate synthase (FAD)
MYDYQEVRLIGVTQPVAEEFISDPTAENLISYCARVSNPKNQDNFKTSGKLLKYCIDHQHWSIFEMVNLTLEIKTTRDIVRQILRHRSFSFQEFSQRYAEVDTNAFVLREARLQDKKNRQSSIDTNDVATKHLWEVMQREVIYAAEKSYKWAIDNGIAKEQARAVLPEGITMSTIYMQGSLRSWLHYTDLRSDNGTQKEHRDIAIKCRKIIEDQFPFIKNQE